MVLIAFFQQRGTRRNCFGAYGEPDEGMGQTQILFPLDGNVFIAHLKKG